MTFIRVTQSIWPIFKDQMEALQIGFKSYFVIFAPEEIENLSASRNIHTVHTVLDHRSHTDRQLAECGFISVFLPSSAAGIK